MEKQAGSLLRRVKTIMKIWQSKTKMKEITKPCRPKILIHLLLGVKLKWSFWRVLSEHNVYAFQICISYEFILR